MKHEIGKSEIKTIALSRLRNEEYFGFHDKVVKLVNEYSLSEAFLALVTIYNERYDDVDAALEVIRKSVHTAQLREADRKRCETFRGLRMAVAACLRHFEPAQRQAAARVNNILWHYRDAVLKSLNEKTASLTNMLQDLREKTSADLQALGLANWLLELETNNQAYKDLEAQRLSERAGQFDKNVMLARKAMDAAYESLVKGLDVHMVLNPGDENGTTVVHELNARIDSATRPVAQRRGMAAKRAGLAETSSSASSSTVPAGQEVAG